MTVVLDTSAIIAWVRGETGAEVVEPLLGTAIISTVNWSELAQKLAQYGANARQVATRLRALGVQVAPFTAEDALNTAELWTKTRSNGLSLADRACLVLAQRLGLPTVTADRAWTKIDLPVAVKSIRLKD